jgi:hypothetical protein
LHCLNTSSPAAWSCATAGDEMAAITIAARMFTLILFRMFRGAPNVLEILLDD